ncbi:uncharacterized protein A4U43_C05F19160 [Asparagus officinalis]|uniref:Major facilitator superfamily (MFS) profile domain-containing protein n=1 Tax=Asparagus officinalis TaxID=4686 RepID=A0A5P1ESR4_ASPOF|nr:uncharacterized protein A4U43_C05F19160 [Asparagus officinalis]
MRLFNVLFSPANEIFEKVASQGLLANMIIYLTKVYHMTTATGANVLLIWYALSNFMPIFGASLSDSYFGRFGVIALGSFISLAGMLLLWLSAALPGARPANCDDSSGNCNSATSSQLALLFSSFALISIGAGGIRPCSLTFGADQLERKDDPQNERKLQSYFNFYYACVATSIIVAVTVIVYVQDLRDLMLDLAFR